MRRLYLDGDLAGQMVGGQTYMGSDGIMKQVAFPPSPAPPGVCAMY